MNPQLSALFASLVRALIIAIATKLGVTLTSDATEAVVVIASAILGSLLWSVLTQKKLLSHVPNDAAIELARYMEYSGLSPEVASAKLVELGITEEQAKQILTRL